MEKNRKIAMKISKKMSDTEETSLISSLDRTFSIIFTSMIVIDSNYVRNLLLTPA